MTIEQLGYALLIGGVRSTARDARRKLDLMRGGTWFNVTRWNQQLHRALSDVPGTDVDCTASFSTDSGPLRLHHTCVMMHDHESDHVAASGVTWPKG